MTFRNYIGSEYKNVKLIIQRNCWKQGQRFDEDIFGDIIIRCLEANEDDYTVSQFNGYMVVAYNHAYVNEIKRHYNSHRVGMPEDVPEDTIIYDKLDLELLYRRAADKFGEELVRLFKLWLSGYSVREIQENYHKENLTYQFKKIKTFLQLLQDEPSRS